MSQKIAKKPACTIMCFGTFDGIHEGHINYLHQAKRLAPAGHESWLVVVVARDITVQNIKGRLPKLDEQSRLAGFAKKEIASLVNLAVLGDKERPLEQVYAFSPNIICIGYDQTSFVYLLEDAIAKKKFFTKIVRAKPFKPERFKSSLMHA